MPANATRLVCRTIASSDRPRFGYRTKANSRTADGRCRSQRACSGTWPHRRIEGRTGTSRETVGEAKTGHCTRSSTRAMVNADIAGFVPNAPPARWAGEDTALFMAMAGASNWRWPMR
jgi:hypothetical protein